VPRIRKPASQWIADDGTDAAWSQMTADQRAALPASDPRHGPDGNGQTHRAYGTLPIVTA